MLRLGIEIPKLDENITEGTIVSWFIKVGDMTQEDDMLFEVGTTKVNAEISSPVAEKVVEILHREGDMVAVGTVVAVVDLDREEFSGTGPINVSGTSPSLAGTARNKSANTTSKPVITEEERRYSPAVIQLAREAKIPKEELDVIQGTDYEGRLSKKDIKDYIGRKKRGGSIGPKPASVVATPAASETSVAISSEQAGPKIAPVAMSGVGVKKMDHIRRVTADHMVMSKEVSPHVANVVEIDVTKLVRWHEKNKDALFHREGVKLTYMPMITEAVAKASAAYPQMNVSVDGYNILFEKRINVGIAASLNGGNLVVPIVHDADHLNLNRLAVAIDSLALKTRDNKLMPKDIDGGTSTITDFGIFKSPFGTPIINQPQVAILGVGYIEKRPAVIKAPEGDTIAIRHKVYLSLSCDHQVVDGMLGGNFLHFIADYLRNQES